MRVPPQVSERIKEAPAQALRGVFAGIGQLLLITNKLRSKAPAGARVPQTRAPEPTEKHEATPHAQAAAAPAPPQAQAGEHAPEARDFDKTGNVRLLDNDKAATGTGAPAAAATEDRSATAETTASAETTATEAAAVTEEAPQARLAEEAADAQTADAGTADAQAADAQAADAGTADTQAADAGDAGMPLPNYDSLSIASLRARLRNLNVAQVRQLAEYERAHAARADVIAMFERRIAKLEAEAADARGEAEAKAEVEAREDTAVEVREDVEAEAEGET